MSLKPITPQAASQLMDSGAVLVDIRAVNEYAREHIAQARNAPFEQLSKQSPSLDKAGALVFYCRSGNRTQLNVQTLAACADSDTYILEGGLDAWKKAGLPVIADASQPLELSRQVHIAAGSLIVLGTLLGASISPWFYGLSGFVGAGLIFAGISGFCGMARVLMKMPWNRKTPTSHSVH